MEQGLIEPRLWRFLVTELRSFSGVAAHPAKPSTCVSTGTVWPLVAVQITTAPVANGVWQRIMWGFYLDISGNPSRAPGIGFYIPRLADFTILNELEAGLRSHPRCDAKVGAPREISPILHS